MGLFTNLQPKPRNARNICLLLDVSYSMDIDDGKGRRIDLLKSALETVPNVNSTPIFCFSSDIVKAEDVQAIPRPHGSTNMAYGFEVIKIAGHDSAILITDGQPDSEEWALRNANGLMLGIIYVGPEPVPSFLERLAAATRGTFKIEDLTNTKQLGASIAGLLENKGDKIICQ